MGRAKAAVFPDPVCASAMTSRLERVMGMDWAWISVGRLYPSLWQVSTRVGTSPSASKVILESRGPLLVAFSSPSSVILGEKDGRCPLHYTILQEEFELPWYPLSLIMNLPPITIAIPDLLPSAPLREEGLVEHSSNNALSVESAGIGGVALDNYVMQHRKQLERVFQELEGEEVRGGLRATRCKVEELLDSVEKRKNIIKERLKRVTLQLEEKKRVHLLQRKESRGREVTLAMQVIEGRIIDCSGEDFSMIATLFRFIQREALEMTDTDILQVLIYANNAEDGNVDGEGVHVYGGGGEEGADAGGLLLLQLST